MFLKQFVKSFFAPREHRRLGQGNGLSAGASEAAKPSAGHWGKMSTGRWAWLSEINLRLLRTKNSQDQSFQPFENIACPNLGNIRKTQDVPLRPRGSPAALTCHLVEAMTSVRRGFWVALGQAIRSSMPARYADFAPDE